MYGASLFLQLLIQDSVLSVCFKNDAAENATACLSMGDNGNATKVGWGIKTTSADRSDIIKGSELPQLVSSSQCHIALKTNGPDGDYVSHHQFRVLTLIDCSAFCTNHFKDVAVQRELQIKVLFLKYFGSHFLIFTVPRLFMLSGGVKAVQLWGTNSCWCRFDDFRSFCKYM